MANYLDARVVTTPFGLYDCDVPCDMSAAVVVSHLAAARDLRATPVRIAALGMSKHGRPRWDQVEDLTGINADACAAQMWSRTDLKPGDVDVAQLYDGFSFMVLGWLEALGFCKRGEAGAFVENGRIELGGALPVNTWGGQLSGAGPRVWPSDRSGAPITRRVWRAPGARLQGRRRQRSRCRVRRMYPAYRYSTSRRSTTITRSAAEQSQLKLVCGLDILFLRPEGDPLIKNDGDGDLDNRLKVIFDALRMPRERDEIPKGDRPGPTETPYFYCLLEILPDHAGERQSR